MEGENLHPLQQKIDPLPQNQQLCHFLGGCRGAKDAAKTCALMVKCLPLFVKTSRLATHIRVWRIIPKGKGVTQNNDAVIEPCTSKRNLTPTFDPNQQHAIVPTSKFTVYFPLINLSGVCCWKINPLKNMLMNLDHLFSPIVVGMRKIQYFKQSPIHHPFSRMILACWQR